MQKIGLSLSISMGLDEKGKMSQQDELASLDSKPCNNRYRRRFYYAQSTKERKLSATDVEEAPRIITTVREWGCAL